MRKSLADFHYFSRPLRSMEEHTVAKPDVIHVVYKDQQILAFFAVKPSQPVKLKGRLSFGVYDPSMYTAVDFPKDEDLVTDGKGVWRLQAQSGEANPG